VRSDPSKVAPRRHAGERTGFSLVAGLVLAIPPLLWAGNFIVGRAASAEVPPMMLAFARQSIALLVLLPVGWAAMRRDRFRYWQHRWLLVRASLAGLVAFNVLVYIGLHSTTASNALLMNSTIPVLIILFGVVFLRQPLRAMQIIGLILSCAGVLAIILHGEVSRLFSLQFSYGDLLVFTGMVAFSLFSVWLRSFPADIDRRGLLGAQFVVAILVLLPLVAWEYIVGYRADWSFRSAATMVYVGVGAGLLANLIYMYGIARVGPARAGLFIHLVPLYGAVMSIVFLGEEIHPYHAVGMAAIIAGLACSQFRSSGHVEAPSAPSVVPEAADPVPGAGNVHPREADSSRQLPIK